MTDNRNTILAVILSGLVLIGWQYFYNVPAMEKQRALQQTQNELVKPSAQTGAATTPAPQTGGAPGANKPAQASAAIVLYSPSGTAEPYYAEFGWVGAAGAATKIPDQNTLWQQEGSGSL